MILLAPKILRNLLSRRFYIFIKEERRVVFMTCEYATSRLRISMQVNSLIYQFFIFSVIIVCICWLGLTLKNSSSSSVLSSILRSPWTNYLNIYFIFSTYEGIISLTYKLWNYLYPFLTFSTIARNYSTSTYLCLHIFFTCFLHPLPHIADREAQDWDDPKLVTIPSWKGHRLRNSL